MPDNRKAEPVQLGDALRRYVRSFDKKGSLDKAAVISVWRDVVGASIDEHTRVEGFRGAELLVAVDSPAWATELSFMAEELKSRLNTKMGQDLVSCIRFTVSASVSREIEEVGAEKRIASRYRDEVETPAPLSPGELRAVEKSVETIKDTDLREVALRATVRDLERKKGQPGPK